MNSFEKPGITYRAKTDFIVMLSCIDIGIAISEVIGKRVAKLEQEELNQDAG
jgi:hypothetical protein